MRGVCISFAFGVALAMVGVSCGGMVSTDLASGDADGGDADDAAADGARGDAEAIDGASDARGDGARSDSGSDDAASDSTSSADSCLAPCLLGGSTCQPTGVATCTLDANGCNVWGPPVACGTNQVCAQTLLRASCTCQPGSVLSGGACVAVIGAPRPIAPLSTATVTSQTPTLHWKLAPATDGAQIDLCHDRTCTNIELTFTAVGSSGAPATSLSPGVHFWRLHGTEAGNVGPQTSPVWELTVGARTAPADTSFGTSPDVDGDGFSDVVVGSVNSSLLADFYVYAGGASGVSTSPTIIHGPTTGFGSFDLRALDVASAGDMNGDGYSDVVVSAYENGIYTVGTIWVYLGGPSGLTSPGIELAAQGTSQYSNRGPITVSPAGDVNGDGYADIIADAAFWTKSVYVFLGGPGGPSTTPFVINEPLDYSPMVAGAGDVNADGYGDVLVFNQSYDGRTSATYLHLGGPSGPSTTPIVFPGDGQLTAAGDVNGDGLADFLMGWTIYYGAAGGVSPTTLALVRPLGANLFGTSIAPAGDTNGDGFADIIVGSPGQNGTSGNAYIFLGAAGGPSMTPVVLSGTGYFGNAVSGAGDVNGDGFSEVLVGASGSGPAPSGMVDVFLGAAGGVSSSTPVVLSSFSTYTFALLDVRRRSAACAL